MVSTAPTTETPRPLDEKPAEGATVPATAGATDGTEDLVEQDLLVEDVSIDGMCGVY